MALVPRIQHVGGSSGNAEPEQPASMCSPWLRVGAGAVAADGARSWGEGSSLQQARLLSKHAGLDGCPSSSSWPGQACRCIYGLSRLLRRERKSHPGSTEGALDPSGQMEIM